MIPLGLIAAGAVIQNKICGSGMITLISSNEEMNDIIKIVKFLKNAGLLKKHVSETVKKKQKKQKKCIVWYIISYIRCQFLRQSINT